jgi:high-affinity K+ transport system ATPase subunit B
MTVTVDRLALRPGDLVRVLPGEVLPVDGEVVAGAAAVGRCRLTLVSLCSVSATEVKICRTAFKLCL